MARYTTDPLFQSSEHAMDATAQVIGVKWAKTRREAIDLSAGAAAGAAAGAVALPELDVAIPAHRIFVLPITHHVKEREATVSAPFGGVLDAFFAVTT